MASEHGILVIMRTCSRLWIFLAVPLLAQTGSSPEAAQPTETPIIRSTTNEVLLDFVVRDKHDKLIRNLTEGEVEIYEDGVKQKLNAFRSVSGREQIDVPIDVKAAAAPGAVQPANVVREVNLVSIVFQRMTREGREFAQKAALEFLNNELKGNTYVAVYSLDYRLNPLSRYTKDHDVLTAAIGRASGGAYQEFGRDAQNVMNQVQTTVTGGQGGLTTSSSMDIFSAPGRMTADTAYSDTAKLMGSMIQELQLKSANADGMQAMTSLLMLARYQATLPGRKTILLLSEGLLVPPDNGEMMRATVSAANRANVSFYSVDVRGLRVQSANSLSLNGIRGITRGVSGLQNRVEQDVREASAQDDRLSNSLHGNTQLNMGELAEGTGGFLIADTNDIQKPMRRIMEDVRTHYEAAYTPVSSSLDGRFRKIEVRVARSNLVVQARSGYYAMPEIGNKPLLPFELLGLNAINRSPAPGAVTFRAGLLRFRIGKSSTRYVFTFEVPVKNVTVTEDAERKVGRVHVSLLGLIRDEHKQVIDRVSRDLANEFPLDKIPALKNGNLIYTQAVDLPPGRYTIECAALDREKDSAGVKRISAVVLEGDAFSVSDISLVRRLEPLTASPDEANPLEFSGGRVTPTLSLSASNATATDLFFVVYPPAAADVAAKTEVYLQFWQNGKLIRQVQPELPAEAPGQGIPVLASAALKSGQYEVRVIAKQGSAFARNTTAIIVEP